MSMQRGDRHGPQQDDALKRDIESELRANRATRLQEWLEPEPPGDDQPEATWPLAGRPGDPEHGYDPDLIELRSELARQLGRAVFPARRAALLGNLAANNAPQQLIDLARTLPADVRFNEFGDVARALGLSVESRRSS
jgi:hypothetical protein